jgi:methyltransferase (TIGR00027 family)
MIHDKYSALSASDDPVSHTAKLIAAKRAIEQWQSAPLFDDPFSKRLAEPEIATLIEQWNKTAQTKGIAIADIITKRTRYIAIRTRFIDDLLLSALSQFQQGQVVILGAGLDTRAYRLTGLSNTSVYEVDHLEVLQYKSSILQDVSPQCRHHLIPGNLADSNLAWVTELLNAGYQERVPTIWVIEGVVMYLEAAQVHALLNTLSSLSVVGSILGMDGVKAGSVQAGHRAAQRDRGRVIRHWQFGYDQPQQLLADYGWSASVYQPQHIHNGYGRYPETIPIQAAISEPHDDRGVWLAQAQKER